MLAREKQPQVMLDEHLHRSKTWGMSGEVELREGSASGASEIEALPTFRRLRRAKPYTARLRRTSEVLSNERVVSAKPQPHRAA